MTVETLSILIAGALRARSPRARQRTLDQFDVADAIRTHLRLAAEAPEGITVRSVLRGGYVPSSYGYSALADEVRLEGRTLEDLEHTARRGSAQIRSHGRGHRLVVRYVAPGQTQGTLAHAA
jgi:plasmid stabilization system protein ParE